MVKVNGTIDALAHIIKELADISNWRLDSLAQTGNNEATLFIEMLDDDKEGVEQYKAILDTDLLTASHLGQVLGIEVEYFKM
jgi:hypothetical protein